MNCFVDRAFFVGQEYVPFPDVPHHWIILLMSYIHIIIRHKFWIQLAPNTQLNDAYVVELLFN